MVARAPAGAASSRSFRFRAKTAIASSCARSRRDPIRSSPIDRLSLVRQAQRAASLSQTSPGPSPRAFSAAPIIARTCGSPASGSGPISRLSTPSFAPRIIASARWLGARAQASECAK